ncbi:MAG: tetratricopeptide repeat protein [Chloroflexi bacterium]|nr:tetratricopeptide repeat protein [Ktedonobacteraceae bacterium]MBV9707416.1 tetratricopeptide repeat protein [Chloroflexota bacterium]
MSNGTPTPVDNTNWLVEQNRWTLYYEQHLRERIAWAVEYVVQHRHQPAQLMKHFGSLLVLLGQAHPRSDLHVIAVELITALHPWPSRWGYWRAWEEEIRFGAEVAARFGKLDQQAEFLAHLTHILYYTARTEEVLLLGKQVLLLSRASHAVLPLVTAGSNIILTLQELGRSEEAYDLLQEISDDSVLHTAPDDARIVALARLGLEKMNLLRSQGHLDKAVSEINQVISWLEGLVSLDTDLTAQAYRNRGVVLWAKGENVAAARDIQQSIELFKQIGDSFSVTLASNNLGLVYWSMGKLDQAEAALRPSVELAERLNARWQLVQVVGNLGLVCLSRGQLQQALLYLERQLDLAIRIGDAAQTSRAYGNRGIVRLHLQEYDLAKDDLEADLAFVKEEGKQEALGCTYVNLSCCHAGLGHREQAVQLAEQGFDIADKTHSVALQVVALRCLAEYQPLQQQRELLQQALTLANRFQRLFDEAACFLSLARLAENKEEQTTLWKQGTCLLEEIGATAWLAGCSPSQPPRLPLLV